MEILVKMSTLSADLKGLRRTIVEFRHEGWRICEGSRCARCEPLRLSGGRIWALTWLRRFLGDGAAMQRLRGLLARYRFSDRGLTDGEVLKQLSWLFSSGQWHVCRIEREVPASAGEAASAPEPPAFPLSERRPAELRRAETPDADTFPSDADLVAAAAVLTEAAAGGAPMCPV